MGVRRGFGAKERGVDGKATQGKAGARPIKTRSIKILSPAKINLFLEVLGRRKDGFHEIRTVFQALDLCDELIMRPRPQGVTLSSDSRRLPLDSRNVVWRAAQLFFARSKVRSGVAIFLRKKIPIAGGLGGGSSNAACTLIGLNKLFRTGWKQSKLTKLAKELGSDVPFFLHAVPSVGTGKGSNIKHLGHHLPFWAVLAGPRGLPQPHKTAGVYKALKTALTRRPVPITMTLTALENMSVGDLAANLFNRLEETVLSREPLAAKIRHFMSSHGAMGALVSGAGPTVFGIVRDRRAAKRLEKIIAGHFGRRVWVAACKSLAKAPAAETRESKDYPVV